MEIERELAILNNKPAPHEIQNKPRRAGWFSLFPVSGKREKIKTFANFVPLE